MVEVQFGGETRDLPWEAWERQVRSGRIPPDALVRFEAITGSEWKRAGDLESYQALASSGATAMARRHARAGAPIVTALLVGLQIRIWWWAQLPRTGAWMEANLTKWTAPTLEQGEIWRPLSMGILHTSFTHALMNLVWLAYTAYHLERALGRRNVLVIYVAAVVGGSALSMFGEPDAPSLGASGGVFGLIAATVVFGLARPELLPERARRVFGFALLPYLIVAFISGMLNVGTDNWSHFGGLLTGGLLAVWADPPDLERRKGWSTRWQTGVLAVIAALLALMYVAGPYIEPLRTEAEARAVALRSRNPQAARQLPTVDVDEPLVVSLPVGWTSDRTLAGDRGWSPPLSGRTWSTTREVLDGPRTVQNLQARWLARLDQLGWPHAFGPLEPTTLAGRAGVQMDGVIHGPETMQVTWRAAAQGLYAVVEVWQVEPELAERLEPLAERLRAATSWSEPRALADAREAHQRHPSGVEARRTLALELAKSGEADEALALQTQLVADKPTSRKERLALLQILTWYPDAAPSLDEVVQDALSAGLGPKVDVALADLLASADREDEAAALLDLAWARAPGERTLSRARRARGLPTKLLDPGAVPTSLAFDPRSGEPLSPAAQAALLDAEPTVGAIKARGEARKARRQELLDAVLAGDAPTGRAALAELAAGYPVEDVPGALERVRVEVQSAVSGFPPAWWDDQLSAETLATWFEDAAPTTP